MTRPLEAVDNKMIESKRGAKKCVSSLQIRIAEGGVYTVKESSQSLSHLTPPHLNWSLIISHFVWAEYAAIGRSHGELGRFRLHDPICRGYGSDQISTLSSDDMRWGEVRWAEWSEPSRIVYVRMLQRIRLSERQWAWPCVCWSWRSWWPLPPATRSDSAVDDVVTARRHLANACAITRRPMSPDFPDLRWFDHCIPYCL